MAAERDQLVQQLSATKEKLVDDNATVGSKGSASLNDIPDDASIQVRTRNKLSSEWVLGCWEEA